jgi:hypothetical protein
VAVAVVAAGMDPVLARLQVTMVVAVVAVVNLLVGLPMVRQERRD